MQRERLESITLEQRAQIHPEHYISVDGKLTNPDAWPIQIRNSVISIDFGSGCLGCTWCITKRQVGRDVIQDVKYNNVLDANTMLELLSHTKAYTEARLPIRIGNNTDGTLIPVPLLEKFYHALPDNYPVALLTRGIHSEELTTFLASTGSNFVLCRTITPPHQSLDYRVNWDKAFKSFKDAQCQKVINIGPCVQETFEQTLSLIRNEDIVPGTRVIIAPLNRRLIPDSVMRTVTAQPITADQMKKLEEAVSIRGALVHRANNCAIAEMNSLPSVEYGDINYETNISNEFLSATIGTSNNRGLETVCEQCPNDKVCREHYQDQSSIALDELYRIASTLGINDVSILMQHPGLTVISSSITKSETSYLSGIFGTRVSGVNSRAQPNAHDAARWKDHNFYPIDEIIEISQVLDPLRLRRRIT